MEDRKVNRIKLPINHIDIAYLAGIIDAHGSISIQKASKTKKYGKGKSCTNVYYALKVSISGTKTEPHELAVSLFGGSISSHQPDNIKYKRQYQWNVSGTTAKEFLNAVIPYLRVKKMQGIIGVNFQDLLEKQRSILLHTQKPPYKVNDQMTNERILLYNMLTNLNEPKNRRKYLPNQTI